MDMSRGYPNRIECGDPANQFGGFMFDNFTLNGVSLTASNWIKAGRFVTRNLLTPSFTNRPAAPSL